MESSGLASGNRHYSAAATALLLSGLGLIVALVGTVVAMAAALSKCQAARKSSSAFIVPNGWADWVNSVQNAAEGLRKAGVNAKTSTPEEAVWIESLTTGDFDVGMQGHFVGATPYKYFETAFHSRNMGERGNRSAASRHKDSELDALIDSFIRTTDLDKQKDIMFAVQERVGASQPIIPLFNNPGRSHFSTKRFTG